MSVTDKPESCIVCLESMTDVKSSFTCGHWIHRECIIRSGRLQCPLCRKRISSEFTNDERVRCYEFEDGFAQYVADRMDSLTGDEIVNDIEDDTPPMEGVVSTGLSGTPEETSQFLFDLAKMAFDTSDVYWIDIDIQLFDNSGHLQNTYGSSGYPHTSAQVRDQIQRAFMFVVNINPFEDGRVAVDVVINRIIPTEEESDDSDVIIVSRHAPRGWEQLDVSYESIPDSPPPELREEMWDRESLNDPDVADRESRYFTAHHTVSPIVRRTPAPPTTDDTSLSTREDGLIVDLAEFIMNQPDVPDSNRQFVFGQLVARLSEFI